MKNYIHRLLHGAKKSELIYWWIMRVLMIGAMIDSIFFRKDIQQSLQTFANLALMFLWEIFQMFPKKTFLRHIQPYMQDILAPGLLVASFGGAYLNFYYSIPAYDLILHIIGGCTGAIGGYEIIVAMQKRDMKQCSAAIAVFGAFCFSFFAGQAWELFEFTFDQIAGGDSQHWSLALAKEAAEQYGIAIPNVISELDTMRYALIDTMEDMICNTLGAVIAWILLKIYPYQHKGKRDVNRMIAEKQLEQAKSAETIAIS